MQRYNGGIQGRVGGYRDTGQGRRIQGYRTG